MRLLIPLMLSFVVHTEIIDRVVAVVNKEPILHSQIKPNLDVETLIDDALIASEIKKLHLDVAESEIDTTISNLMKQNRLTTDTFEAALKQSNGMSLPEYRTYLRKQFYKRNLIQNKVKNRVSTKRGLDVRIQAEQALFKTEAEAIRALKDRTVAFIDAGTITKSELRPELAKAVFTLKEGETSKPLQTPQGYLVIKIKKRIEIPLEKVDRGRYDEELETAYTRYVKELRASAFIERK